MHTFIESKLYWILNGSVFMKNIKFSKSNRDLICDTL